MKNKHEIIEKYSSSTWDRHSILGAINIVQDRIDGIPACLLNKVKFISTENGKEAFNEGWEVTDSTPNNYSCVASMKNKHLAGDYLKTLFSAKGEPKIKYPLPVRSFTYFNLIEQLFDPIIYTFSGGQFLVKHKEKGQERINELLEEFANIEDKPMHYVLDLHYSNFQINHIEKASTQQVSLWVDELEQFAKTEKRIITEEEDMPLFALGLTGFSKTLESRRKMRIDFWRQWIMRRSDIRSFANQYTSPYAQEQWLYG